MQRKTFSGMNCSIARALDEIGEWWSLLIVRECFLGTTRFDQFQERLGIARNILNTRFKRLMDIGVIEKVALEQTGRREGYRLTAKGEELFPILVALQQWGDKWTASENGPPILMVEHETGQVLGPVGPTSSTGRPLGFRDVRLEIGPGGGPSTAQRIEDRNSAVLGSSNGAAEPEPSRKRHDTFAGNGRSIRTWADSQRPGLDVATEAEASEMQSARAASMVGEE